MTRQQRATDLCDVVPIARLFGAREVPLSDPAPTCPNHADHAPMPAGYLAFDLIGSWRLRRGQQNVRCDGCGLYVRWTGGGHLPRWPKRIASLARPESRRDSQRPRAVL